MHWLTPDLAIGSVYLDSDKSALDGAGIRAVLQLSEGVEIWHPHWEVLHLPVSDGQPVPCATLAQGRDFVQAQRADKLPTLIACLMGQSRSSAFAFACLLADGYAPADAWRLLLHKHPNAAPHPYLLQSVLDCCGAGLSVNDLYAVKTP